MKYHVERGKDCFFIKDTSGRIIESYDFNEHEEAKIQRDRMEQGLTLDEIEIGMKVAYINTGKREPGVVTSKSPKYAFVRYAGTNQPVATRADYLIKEDV